MPAMIYGQQAPPTLKIRLMTARNLSMLSNSGSGNAFFIPPLLIEGAAMDGIRGHPLKGRRQAIASPAHFTAEGVKLKRE
jgi:hypothetical protein